jgi:hypothetical protein
MQVYEVVYSHNWKNLPITSIELMNLSYLENIQIRPDICHCYKNVFTFVQTLPFML